MLVVLSCECDTFLHKSSYLTRAARSISLICLVCFTSPRWWVPWLLARTAWTVIIFFLFIISFFSLLIYSNVFIVIFLFSLCFFFFWPILMMSHHTAMLSLPSPWPCDGLVPLGLALSGVRGRPSFVKMLLLCYVIKMLLMHLVF